jgi:hypothetical protein
MLYNANPQTAVTIEYVMAAARNNKWAGITRDGSIVITFDCVYHQLKQERLVLYVYTDWRLVGSEGEYKYTIIYCPVTRDEYDKRIQITTLERLYKKSIKSTWLEKKLKR